MNDPDDEDDAPRARPEPDYDDLCPRELSPREEDFAAAEHFAHLDRIHDQ